ncbi:MAG: hypothetical protein JXR62_00750 [Bacilli bacterium]|nr:hypothetical protein [Bacilli bacterium]
MKKLMLFLVIPSVIFGVFALSRIVSAKEIDYDVLYGNSLHDVDYIGNTYIETVDKDLMNYNVVIPPSFVLMSEDDTLQLYLEEETLAIAVRVKANGYVYSSYNFNDSFAGKGASVVNPIKSGVVLDLYKESTPTSQSYLDEKEVFIDGVSTVSQIAKSVITPTLNGFKAAIDFDNPELMIKFDLYVEIIQGELVVNIPNDSIIEYNPNLWVTGEEYYSLRNIVLFPYFGSTKSVNDGYVVIPDGSGALISLEASPDIKASFTLDVYGDDLGYSSPAFRTRALSVKDVARITMPIYGMVHDVGNTGFLVISESGANYGLLNFKSAGIINDYYNTYFSYRYRESYEQYQSRANEDQYRISLQEELDQYDLTQKYVFLSGEEASYVGMAKAYQNYLLDSNQLGDKRRSIYSETPTKIDFIGAEITNGILSSKTQEVTTYNEIVEILKELKNDGYSELIGSLKTYNMSKDSYRFDIYRQLGGKSDFENMLKYMADNDIPFSYYSDYVRSYADYSKMHAQTLSKRSIYYIELSWMFYAHNTVSAKYYMDFAKDDVDELSKYNINSIALAGFDRSIFTSYKNRVIFSNENMDLIMETLAYLNEQEIHTNLYLPDAYLYQYVDEYYDAPIGSSEFSFQAATIPFLQLVVGGYMDMYSPYLNFVSDETTSLLRMVEFGVFPSYVLTGSSPYVLKNTNSSNVYISEYSVLSRRIGDYYNLINEGLTATIGLEMTDHTFLAEGVSMVEYDNSTQIIINYNTVDVTIGSIIVPSQGYVVIP